MCQDDGGETVGSNFASVSASGDKAVEQIGTTTRVNWGCVFRVVNPSSTQRIDSNTAVFVLLPSATKSASTGSRRRYRSAVAASISAVSTGRMEAGTIAAG